MVQEHVLVQHVASFDGIPAGGNQGSLIDAGWPVDLLDGLRLALPKRQATTGLGHISHRPFDSGQFLLFDRAFA